MRVKLHGAFRSGTNYIKALLELNLDVELVALQGGWKHAPPSDPPWPIIGVVRLPNPWVAAVWRFVQLGGRKHITCGETWHSFLRQPIIVTDGEREDIPSFPYRSPPDYWNTMTRSLIPHTLIRYEDAVRDPERVCNEIAEILGLPRKGVFIPVEQRTRNMVDRPRSQLDEYVTGEAFTPRSVPRFGWRDRRYLRQNLSKELLTKVYS